MKYLSAVASLCVAVSLAWPAHAQSDGIVRISNPNVVETILKDLGAEILRREARGKNVLLGVKMEGETFAVSFEGCVEATSCPTLRFVDYWKRGQGLSVERANAWNVSRPFVKVAVDPEGDTVATMEVPTEGSVSEEHFTGIVAAWIASLTAFTEFLRDGQ